MQIDAGSQVELWHEPDGLPLGKGVSVVPASARFPEELRELTLFRTDCPLSQRFAQWMGIETPPPAGVRYCRSNDYSSRRGWVAFRQSTEGE